MHFTKKNILISLTVLVVGFIGYILWQMNFRFLPAEGRLKSEISALNLTPEFVLQSSTFTPGSCLDNCPLLQNVYKVEGTREHFGQMLKQSLENRGYVVDYSAGTVFTTTKKNVSVFSNAEPSLGTGTMGYESNIQQQDQKINKITLSFMYRP